MAEQASKVSGVVHIDGTPAQRTVRAYSYEVVAQTVNGADLTLSKSLGHASSDPATGEYTIDLLDGYDQRIFVVAFDDYGADFKPDLAVTVGDRVHPTTPNGHIWECTGSGTLPSEEPAWVIDTETAQLYGTASMIARPFYRPMVHGPVTPQVVTVAVDDYFSSVVALLHMDEDWSDKTEKTWTPINSPTFSTDVKRFGSASGSFVNGPYLEGPTSDAWAFGNQDFTVECWAYATEMPAVYYQAPMGNWYSSTGGCFFLRPNGVMSWHSGSQQVVSGAGVIQVAKWHHLAYSRKDGVGRLFVDGVKVGPDLSDTTNFTWTQAWRIGGNRVASDWWRGFVDEVRITKGVARYTESFTSPTKAFPNQGPAVQELPTVIGEPFGGGFYAGDIEYDGKHYKLIVAEKGSEISGLKWGPYEDLTQATNNRDGLNNTLAMQGDARYEAGAHCLDYVVGDIDDWYLPATEELLVIYNNLSSNNSPPTAFQAGGAQAFEDYKYYWASVQSGSGYAKAIRFTAGNESTIDKQNTTFYTRPIRRIEFTPQP